MTDEERIAREWWNAHWTQQDGAAISSLAALLAREREKERELAQSMAWDYAKKWRDAAPLHPDALRRWYTNMAEGASHVADEIGRARSEP